MVRFLARVVAVMALVATASTVLAEEIERPAWLSDEVVGAAMDIGLSEEQLPSFRANVREFLEDYRDEVQRLIRRGEMNLESQIKRARNNYARQMDKQMAELLSEDQMTRYEDYRAALLDAVSPE